MLSGFNFRDPITDSDRYCRRPDPTQSWIASHDPPREANINIFQGWLILAVSHWLCLCAYFLAACSSIIPTRLRSTRFHGPCRANSNFPVFKAARAFKEFNNSSFLYNVLALSEPGRDSSFWVLTKSTRMAYQSSTT